MKARQRFRMVLLGTVLIFFFVFTNSNAQSFVFEMPVDPDEAYLIQKYDVYNSTAEGYHTGIDLYTKGGKPTIYPTAPGLVVIIQPNGPCSDYHGEGGGCEDHGLGNTVIIEHIVENGQRIYSLYAHLDSINPSLHEGSVVGHSDPIGIMGASGYGLSEYWKNSDGTPAIHLHFEIKDQAVLSNPKSEGIHFGYVPSSADNYGYHNPYTFLDRVEDIIVRTDEAKPLPNGVTVQNLSIALSKIERRNYQTSPEMLDELNLEFILRKIKPGDKHHRTNRIIIAEVIDDHGNIYEGSHSGYKVIAIENIINRVPLGFTWASSLRISKIPSVAPLTKLKVYFMHTPDTPSYIKEDLMVLDLSTPHLKLQQVKDFQSELREKDCIDLPYEAIKEKYFLLIMHKVKKTENDLIIPLTLKNTDYNPRYIYHHYHTTGIQYSDGRVAWIFPAATFENTFDVKIPGLNEKTVEMHLPLGAAISNERRGSRSPLIISKVPKLIIFLGGFGGKDSEWKEGTSFLIKLIPENLE